MKERTPSALGAGARRLAALRNEFSHKLNAVALGNGAECAGFLLPRV